MKLIAFGHRRRMGKDTAASILIKELRRRFPTKMVSRGSFAEKVKQICHELYGWAGCPSEIMCDADPTLRQKWLPDLDMTVRDLWIKFSTQGVRNMIHQDTWVNYLLSRIDVDYLVITDLRFPNEFARIKDSGGICVKVHRDRVETWNDEADSALAGELGWDYELRNLTIDETVERMRELAYAV